MSKRSGPNKDNLEQTRSIFLEIAKKEFCEHGYANASTTRIVNDSGMARGSLYYHFGDKNGLFKAIYEDLLVEALKQISIVMDNEKSPLQALLVGANAFLDLCVNADFRKIALIQSQSALAYEERLVLLDKTLLGKLREIMPELIETGYFPGHTVDTALIFILGVLAEFGRALDYSPAIPETRALFGQAFATTVLHLHRDGHNAVAERNIG